MENPIDTTTDPTARLMRRIQALEEQLDQLENGRISQIAYFTGNAAQVAAKLAELASARSGSVMAILEDKGVEGVFTNFYVKFPSGWVKF